MGKYHFELLAKYNKKANNLMNNVIITLTEEQWNKKFTGYFNSIHEICSHIYFWDYNWFKRYKLLRNFNCFTDGFIDKYDAYVKILFSNIKEYVIMRNDMDKKIIEFINEITENDLENILEYKTKKGIVLEKRMDGLLIHLFNHQTHHRGMISLYLEMLGKENNYNNILPLVYKEDIM